ncbi:MAG: hypothetical protein ACLQBQ_12605 [Smithella sp.]
MRELDKNPDIRITGLEGMTGLPIGEVCKIRYFWKWEKKREGRDKALVKSVEKSVVTHFGYKINSYWEKQNRHFYLKHLKDFL